MADTADNDYPADCYIDSRWGQYGSQRLAELFGTEQQILDMAKAYREDDGEIIAYIDDEIVEELNDRIGDNQLAYWHDGEFYIFDTSEWCDGDSDCDNEECGMH
jgi:hypothetical protein